MKDADEDEDSVGVDLAAWEAPPPAPGLADAVIAKLREPAAAAALEATESSKLRWWIAGGTVAAAAIAALVVFAVGGGEHLTGSGAVATAKPSRIDLGAASSADLEANTDVRWVRDGRRLVAMQPRGTASWRVAPDDKLVIDAGATVASVVASGASLRVEVHPMHVTEARLLAGSAVISAAVALVTVVVYEGQVEVTGGGRTTTVAPGTTVEIRPLVPPREASDDDLVARLQRGEAERQRLLAELEQLRTQSGTGGDELRRLQATLDEKDRQLAELTRKYEEMAAGAPTTVEKRLDASAIEKMMTRHRAALVACGGNFDGKIEVVLTVARSGRVTGVQFTPTAPPQACLHQVIKRFDFGVTTGGTFGYTLVMKPDKKPVTVQAKSPDCADPASVDEADDRADGNQNAGNYAAALAGYKQILKCKPAVITKAYLAACRARAFSDAKRFYKLLNKESLAQICMKEGFDPRAE